MNTTYQGYFVPTSMSSNYVRTKTNTQGANVWDTEAAEINIDKQRALQSLNDRYSQSLNDAYANYLAQKNLVANSSMGQGYKMAYDKALGQNFAATEQELTSNVTEARQTIESSAQSALNQSQENFETNVANLNRIGMLSESYLNYVKSLRDVNNEMTYFGNTDLTSNATLNDLYAKMIGTGDLLTDETIAAGYVDEENQAAKSFTEFVNNQIDSDKDKDFYDWFLTKGYNEFRTGVQDKTREYMTTKRTELDNTILSNALESGSYTDPYTNKTLKFEDNKVKINDKYLADTNEYLKSLSKDNMTYVSQGNKLYKLSVKNGEYELTDGINFKVFNDSAKYDPRGFKINGKFLKNDFSYLSPTGTSNLIKELEKNNHTIKSNEIFYYNGNTYIAGNVNKRTGKIEQIFKLK